MKRLGDNRVETAKRFLMKQALDDEELDELSKKRATAIDIKTCLTNIGDMEFFQFARCMQTISVSEGLPDDVMEYSLKTLYTFKKLVEEELVKHKPDSKVARDLRMFLVSKSWVMAITILSHIDKPYKTYVMSLIDEKNDQDWDHMVALNLKINELCKKVQTSLNGESKWKELAKEIRDVQQEEESWNLMFSLRSYQRSYGNTAYDRLLAATSDTVKRLTAGSPEGTADSQEGTAGRQDEDMHVATAD